MKIAHSNGKNKSRLVASDAAPENAFCPFCGGQVVLRHRKLMNNSGITYFWKHQGNLNRTCTARARPVQELRYRVQ